MPNAPICRFQICENRLPHLQSYVKTKPSYDNAKRFTALSHTVKLDPIPTVCNMSYFSRIIYFDFLDIQQAGSICIKNLKWKNKQFVVNSFYQNKWKGILKIFFCHNWLANLHGFANICKLPVSNTFKNMHSKI